MPGITYTIRFIHRDPRGGIPCEEQELSLIHISEPTRH